MRVCISYINLAGKHEDARCIAVGQGGDLGFAAICFWFLTQRSSCRIFKAKSESSITASYCVKTGKKVGRENPDKTIQIMLVLFLLFIKYIGCGGELPSSGGGKNTAENRS